MTSEGASPTYRIVWRPLAAADLTEIGRYIANDSPARARAFGDPLRQRTERLATHPEIGRPGRTGTPPGVRELVAHPNYIIFYRVVAEERVVEILRIKHAARRWP